MALKNQKTAEALQIEHNLQSSQVIYSNLKVSGDCTTETDGLLPQLLTCLSSPGPHQVLPNPAVSSNSQLHNIQALQHLKPSSAEQQ